METATVTTAMSTPLKFSVAPVSLKIRIQLWILCGAVTIGTLLAKTAIACGKPRKPEKQPQGNVKVIT